MDVDPAAFKVWIRTRSCVGTNVDGCDGCAGRTGQDNRLAAEVGVLAIVPGAIRTVSLLFATLNCSLMVG